MRHVDEYIQNNVEKKMQLHAYEIAEELWDLVKALDEKGHIRQKLKGTKEEERREELLKIQKNADKIGKSFNNFLTMYLDKPRREKFFELTKEFGFTDEDLSHLLHSHLVFMFLLNIELFRTFLVLIMKNVNPNSTTLGRLFNTNGGNLGSLVRLTRENKEAESVAKRLNINLRNALAHFAFREEGRAIHYYNYSKDGGLWALKEGTIDSTNLFIEMKEHSLLRAILGVMIVDWYGL